MGREKLEFRWGPLFSPIQHWLPTGSWHGNCLSPRVTEPACGSGDGSTKHASCVMRASASKRFSQPLQVFFSCLRMLTELLRGAKQRIIRCLKKITIFHEGLGELRIQCPVVFAKSVSTWLAEDLVSRIASSRIFGCGNDQLWIMCREELKG